MDQLALVCEDIARVSSKLKKIQRLAHYLRSLNDCDLQLAVQLLSDGPVFDSAGNHSLFESDSKDNKLSVPRSAIRDALQIATGWDVEIMRLCFSETGDSGETAALLLKGIAAGEPMSLTQADDLYRQLAVAGSTLRKRDLMLDVFRRFRPLTLKYFVKMITRGLRIGLMSRMVEEAVAQACGMAHEDVRAANNRLGHLAKVAFAARRGELAAIEARLFHPMDFMLAKPLERLEDLADPADWFIEDKFDGIRSQIHFDQGQVQIFTRGMEDVTHAFPELVAACRQLPAKGILDGEILAWRDDRPLSFNVLQQRIARKAVRATLLQEVPVVFVGYDALLHNQDLLLNHSLEDRRSALESILASADKSVLKLSSQQRAVSQQQVEDLFNGARGRGNEGLLLKRRGSPYEPGKRTGAWQKMKRPFGTLEVVITSAEQGHGRRAIYLSDYTFAVRADSAFLNIGKAYSGLTDAEVRELTRILRSSSTEKFGRVILVKPEVVLEVAFDGVQKSSRHKSGFALRFPRIVRWRKDKRAEEADDLDRVKNLYQSSLHA